jgi:hypothetical protein
VFRAQCQRRLRPCIVAEDAAGLGVRDPFQGQPAQAPAQFAVARLQARDRCFRVVACGLLRPVPGRRVDVRRPLRGRVPHGTLQVGHLHVHAGIAGRLAVSAAPGAHEHRLAVAVHLPA